jgi:succinate dehydrogenase / fumarate reductase membrane anchor subunit
VAPITIPVSGIIKEGVEHWWRERLTAVALIPPALWFIASMIAHAGSDYNADDGVATGALFYHTALGLQVIIEITSIHRSNF